MKTSKDYAKATAGPATAGSPPGGLPAPRPNELRISVDRKPYAEIIGHAIVEPDVEVCGVLVGRFEQDANGPYVHVSAAIRGEAAKEQGAAVTFTHETWSHIHGEMDHRFPDDQIVGWYHTHGGFGVFLSEMDVFVHDNFFPEKLHLAYVYDPLAGSEAFFHRTEGGLQPAPRYWLGGRERKPATRLPEAPAAAAPAASPGAVELERVATALQAIAESRSSTLPLLPWLVAAGALLLLFFDGRGAVQGAPRGQQVGAIAVLDRDPVSGQAVGIPIEALEPLDGSAYRDRLGNFRLGVELRSADGALLLQPGLLTRLVQPPRTEAELAEERHRVEAAARDRGALTRMLAWGGSAVLLAAALLLGAWYFFSRRR